jgi:carbon-monoxide dehydrogenase medium subunit
MQNFAYHRPSSIAEAAELVKKAQDGKFMAGGQSLIPVMKLGLAQPTEVVQVGALRELQGIRVEGRALVIGAAATHAEVAASADVRKSIPALADLAGHIGDPQVRNRGTLGGSLAHDDPAADYPAAVLGLDATVVTHRRHITAADFFRGMFETALDSDEIVTAVRFPIPEKAAYAKFPHPASRFAIVGVFVAKNAHGVRVAVTGAGPSVFRLAAMEKALTAKFSPESLRGVTVPSDGLVGDPTASAEYRAHLIGVMAKRAVAACT